MVSRVCFDVHSVRRRARIPRTATISAAILTAIFFLSVLLSSSVKSHQSPVPSRGTNHCPILPACTSGSPQAPLTNTTDKNFAFAYRSFPGNGFRCAPPRQHALSSLSRRHNHPVSTHSDESFSKYSSSSRKSPIAIEAALIIRKRRAVIHHSNAEAAGLPLSLNRHRNVARKKISIGPAEDRLERNFQSPPQSIPLS